MPTTREVFIMPSRYPIEINLENRGLSFTYERLTSKRITVDYVIK